MFFDIYGIFYPTVAWDERLKNVIIPPMRRSDHACKSNLVTKAPKKTSY